MRRISVMGMLVLAACGGSAASGERLAGVVDGAPRDGGAVSASWSISQIVATDRCRDGSVLSWTSSGWWRADLIFHSAPGFKPVFGEEPLKTCDT